MARCQVDGNTAEKKKKKQKRFSKLNFSTNCKSCTIYSRWANLVFTIVLTIVWGHAEFLTMADISNKDGHIKLMNTHKTNKKVEKSFVHNLFDEQVLMLVWRPNIVSQWWVVASSACPGNVSMQCTAYCILGWVKNCEINVWISATHMFIIFGCTDLLRKIEKYFLLRFYLQIWRFWKQKRIIRQKVNVNGITWNLVCIWSSQL